MVAFFASFVFPGTMQRLRAQEQRHLRRLLTRLYAYERVAPLRLGAHEVDLVEVQVRNKVRRPTHQNTIPFLPFRHQVPADPLALGQRIPTT